MKSSKYIDHTQLKPDATKEKIVALCEEARLYDFASVCINPCWIPLAKELLAGSGEEISEIGETVGFVSSAHFSHVFKKLEGCTPTEYRINSRMSRKTETGYETDKL